MVIITPSILRALISRGTSKKIIKSAIENEMSMADFF
jgi:hypothetical protein